MNYDWFGPLRGLIRTKSYGWFGPCFGWFEPNKVPKAWNTELLKFRALVINHLHTCYMCWLLASALWIGLYLTFTKLSYCRYFTVMSSLSLVSRLTPFIVPLRLHWISYKNSPRCRHKIASSGGFTPDLCYKKYMYDVQCVSLQSLNFYISNFIFAF